MRLQDPGLRWRVSARKRPPQTSAHPRTRRPSRSRSPRRTCRGRSEPIEEDLAPVQSESPLPLPRICGCKSPRSPRFSGRIVRGERAKRREQVWSTPSAASSSSASAGTPTVAMAPAADHPGGHVLVEPLVPQLRGEGLIAGVAGHIADHVDVIGRARRRSGRLRDPQHDRRTPDEHELVRENPEFARRELELRNAHDAFRAASAPWSSRAATERTRTSPTRSESTRHSSRASSGCTAAAWTHAGWSGGSS